MIVADWRKKAKYLFRHQIFPSVDGNPSVEEWHGSFSRFAWTFWEIIWYPICGRFVFISVVLIHIPEQFSKVGFSLQMANSLFSSWVFIANGKLLSHITCYNSKVNSNYLNGAFSLAVMLHAQCMITLKFCLGISSTRFCGCHFIRGREHSKAAKIFHQFRTQEKTCAWKIYKVKGKKNCWNIDCWTRLSALCSVPIDDVGNWDSLLV